MANKRVKVSVTEDDYEVARLLCTVENRASWPWNCVMTVAGRRRISYVRSSGLDCFNAFYGGAGQKITLPLKARQAIADFDDGKVVAPFSFYITVPEELLHV